MGVLYVTPNWSGFSELWIDRMIEGLEPDVVAVAARAPQQRRWRRRIPALRLADTPAPLWRRVARRAGLPIAPVFKSAAQVLAEAIADDAVSVVLVHYIDFALRFERVWAQTSKPLFVHAHGYDTEWDYHRSDKPGQRYFPPDYVAAVRRLSERAIMIADSQCVVRRLTSAGVPPERVVLQYCGIPAPAVPPRHSACTTGVEVLYLGRLVDCKGPDLVIRAFERACAQGLDGRLTLAGDGYLRTTCELLRRRSRFADRIRMLGAVDADTGARLRSTADIFTAHNCRGPLSHQEESFGVSVLEAMAAGLPVITGRSGGVCETILHRKTGVLLEPGDIEEHAAALLRLARDPDLRRRMGAAGWRRAREVFSCERRWPELRQTLGLEPRAASTPAKIQPLTQRR